MSVKKARSKVLIVRAPKCQQKVPAVILAVIVTFCFSELSLMQLFYYTFFAYFLQVVYLSWRAPRKIVTSVCCGWYKKLYFSSFLCILQPGIYLKILAGFFCTAARVEKEDKWNEAVLLPISFPYIDNRKLSNLNFCRLSNTSQTGLRIIVIDGLLCCLWNNGRS